ncbi:MAG TPA: transcriptional regulator [Dialister sp.]|nr:transcriptional regulator [Dialister sp.]
MIPKSLDDTDIKIISELRKNGRISMTELGKRVYLTSQAAKNRLERLQDLGIVQRYTVNVNCPVFGYAIHGIFELTTTEETKPSFLHFVESTEFHILHCYEVDGEHHFFIDAHFDSEESMAALGEALQQFGDLVVHPVSAEIHSQHPVDE